ncbi:MAG: DUF4443 domain-containing protein [Candidatus Helarchaeota archaeon]
METIQKLVARRGPGHLFQLAHFFLALKVIAERGPIGRYELGRILELGGGSIRTLVNRMKKANLITVEGKKGHIFTKIGEQVLKEIEKIIIAVETIELAEELTTKRFNVGCQARGVSAKIGSGINLRDAAITVGAKSSTTLIYTGTEFQIPTLGDNYLARQHPKLEKYLLSKFQFHPGDVLIICGADTLIEAKLGAITAVFSLMNS